MHGSPVGFAVLAQGWHSGHQQPQLIIFDDAATWLEHCAAMHDGHQADLASAVDRPGRMLVEVALGVRRSGGYRVEVTAVTVDRAGVLTVHAVEHGPAPGEMAAAVISQPFVVVAVAATLGHRGPAVLDLSVAPPGS